MTKSNEYRQLTKEEKALASKNLVVLADELEYLQAELKKEQVFLETAPITYKKQLKDMENRVKSIENTIEEHKQAIVIVKNQIENGVEVKKQDKNTSE